MIYKVLLKIEPKIKNLLEFVQYKFLAKLKKGGGYSLNLIGDSYYTCWPWFLNLENHHVRLKESSVGMNLYFANRRQFSSYLVHNGRTSSFKKVPSSDGVIASNLDVGFFGSSSRTLSCKLLILEFDAAGNRIGTITVKMNNSYSYVPKQGVKKNIVAIEFKGYGNACIHAIKMNALQSMVMNRTSTSIGAQGFVSDESVDKWRYLFHDTLLNLARAIPRSNGSRYYSKLPFKVGIITDIYMYNFYKDAFQDIHYLSPDNFEEVLCNNVIDIVLYVTSWTGINDDEWRGVKFKEKPMLALDKIISFAKAKEIKLVFQSIEDPSNFEYFLPIAKKFDSIFTSDTDSIPKYIAECGHSRVYYGEYGFNPLLNNPIGCRKHIIDAIFFAGSYPARYADRCNDMDAIFDSIIQSKGNLIIADRNYGKDIGDFAYPDRFQDAIIPPIEHDLLQSVHKLFRFNLNFNSIKNSPTMCAMRVYELQAQGGGILSNYAYSVFNKFPGMRIVPDLQDLSYDFRQIAGLDEYHLNMQNVRAVFNEKSSYEIINKMITNIGYEESIILKPVVCILYDNASQLLNQSFARQKYSNCLFLLSEEINSLENWNALVKDYGIKYFTWFTMFDEYEDNYIIDMVNAFKYTNAHYITKNAYFDELCIFHNGIQHDYTDIMSGRAYTLFATDVFNPYDFIHLTHNDVVNTLGNGYSIDPFELNYSKYIRSLNLKDNEDNYELSVIVPVFNNGYFLLNKCIQSLKRNNLWPKMEVLLIDDGSTDIDSVKICKQLALEYFNIKTFFFEGEASGTASRARNKGISLATAPLLSFLDPDNEISPGGYDRLHKLFYEALNSGQEIDFLAGYHLKVEEKSQIIGRHTLESLTVIDNLKDYFFAKNNFPVIPTQPTVISRKMFENKYLRFIENAAGQDSLFGWELVCQANKGAFTGDVYLVYYAQRMGSVTNLINKNYFRSKLNLEQAQIQMLRRNEILEFYLNSHFNHFMEKWYLPKLSMVKDEAEYADCLAILKEIAKLYGRDLNLLSK